MIEAEQETNPDIPEEKRKHISFAHLIFDENNEWYMYDIHKHKPAFAFTLYIQHVGLEYCLARVHLLKVSTYMYEFEYTTCTMWLNKLTALYNNNTI